MGSSDYFEELMQRGFGGSDQTVCLECILDDSLRRQVAGHLTEAECSFCHRVAGDGEPAIAVELELVMRSVLDAIKFLYLRADDALFLEDDQTRRFDSSEVAFSVAEGAVTDGVLEAIQELVNPDEWVDDPGMLRPDDAMGFAWEDFTQKVKHETRFVFLSTPEKSSGRPDEFTAAEILEKVAQIIEELGLRLIGPGETFWRARMRDTPDLDGLNAATLGSPPLLTAAANRMSPAGISMFYGSGDVATAVAETSAHRPKPWAVVGGFETVKPLQVVDLTNLPAADLFDSDRRVAYFDRVFLRAFARDLTKSVSYDGQEHIDYVPTQVVTEYLRRLPKFAVDGILFTSSQNGGVSCVLFVGPEACAEQGMEGPATVLRLRTGSVHAVQGSVSPSGA